MSLHHTRILSLCGIFIKENYKVHPTNTKRAQYVQVHRRNKQINQSFFVLLLIMFHLDWNPCRVLHCSWWCWCEHLLSLDFSSLCLTMQGNTENWLKKTTSWLHFCQWVSLFHNQQPRIELVYHFVFTNYTKNLTQKTKTEKSLGIIITLKMLMCGWW